jgi:transcriptional regulator with XRE-family HTH domain
VEYLVLDEELGRLFRKAREDKFLTQQQLSVLTSIPRSTISQIEKSSFDHLSVRKLAALLRELDSDDLLRKRFRIVSDKDAKKEKRVVLGRQLVKQSKKTAQANYSPFSIERLQEIFEKEESITIQIEDFLLLISKILEDVSISEAQKKSFLKILYYEAAMLRQLMKRDT